MPSFAANLSMMFTEMAFLDRFAAAADAGFEAVEFLFPYDHRPDEIARRAEAAGVRIVLFNLPPGDFAAGARPCRIPRAADGVFSGIGDRPALRSHTWRSAAPFDGG